MQIIKINLHSIADLITNSSTVIFTYSEGSLPAAKELMNEVFKLLNIDKSFDDIFYAKVLPKNISDHDDTPDNWKELLHQYIKDEIEFQSWMDPIEKYDYCTESTTLYLIPKDEKYNELANKLLKYLYSTGHEATRDG